MDDSGSGPAGSSHGGRVGRLRILEDWRDLAWRAGCGLRGCLDWCQEVVDVFWWLRRADLQGVLSHSKFVIFIFVLCLRLRGCVGVS